MQLSNENAKIKEKFIIFLTSFSYPTKFAHPTHGLYMARAFSKVLEDNFMFVVSHVTDKAILNKTNFLEAFPTFGKLLTKIHLRTPFYFFWVIYFFLKNRELKNKDVVFFVNDPRLAILLLTLRPLLGFRMIFEAHGLYNGFYRFFIFSFADKFVFVTEGLKNKISTLYKRVEARSITLSNAVDVERFKTVTEDKVELRKKLSLPEDKFIIGYVGRFKPLGIEKGVIKLVLTLKYLPESFSLCCVGGSFEEIEEYRSVALNQNIENRIIFIPHINTDLVPRYCKSFNLLAYIPEGSNAFFDVETSPMKLFEYMASEVPTLVSDLKTTREILDESCTFFVSSDSDEKEVSDAIMKIQAEKDESKTRAKMALNKVSSNTWINRAERIADFLK